MFRDKSVGVVVPAYNEEGFVGETLAGMPPFVDRVYAIDDASTDGTWEEITRTTAELQHGNGHDTDRIVPIRHARNRGVGAAIKSGYERAVDDGLDVVAVMAGDGQMDPEVLATLVEPVASGRVDYAKGNRLHRREDRTGMSRWRLFGNAVLTMLTRISSGYWRMTDPQNGYTVVSRRALETIPIDQLYDRYGFANDLLAVLNAYRFRIADVRHPARYGNEQSSIRYSTFVPMLSWLLLRRFVWRLNTRYLVRGFHPLVPAYATGALGVVVGVAAGAYAVTGFGGNPFVGVLGATSVLLLGMVLLVMAMWFDGEDNRALVEIIDPTIDDRGWAAVDEVSEPIHSALTLDDHSVPARERDDTARHTGGVEQLRGDP